MVREKTNLSIKMLSVPNTEARILSIDYYLVYDCSFYQYTYSFFLSMVCRGLTPRPDLFAQSKACLLLLPGLLLLPDLLPLCPPHSRLLGNYTLAPSNFFCLSNRVPEWVDRKENQKLMPPKTDVMRRECHLQGISYMPPFNLSC